MGASSSSTLLEIEPVGRDRKPPKDKPERARDKGAVRPLGVEVDAAIYDALDKQRKAKKWSKRTAVEEALRDWLAKEGAPLPSASSDEDE